jgi:2-phosphosulfolactate phosphatase
MIEFHRVTLDDLDGVGGLVVVIDVLRAFTTAAYAFDAGASEMILVSSLDEARDLKRRFPDYLLTGEDGGRKPEDFDFGNSPQEFIGRNVSGRTLIMRTTAGTQGVVRSTSAEVLFAVSLCCARSTADAIRALEPGMVTFVLTGVGPNGFGDEDAACADYIEAILQDRAMDLQDVKRRVRNSGWGSRFGDPQFPFLDMRDLANCLQTDCFPFAMKVFRREGAFLLRPIMPGEEGTA